MKKAVNNKKGEAGCIIVLIAIVLLIISLTTNILNRIAGDEIAPWCKFGLFLVVVFFYGYYSPTMSRGPHKKSDPSVIEGLVLVGIVLLLSSAAIFLGVLDGPTTRKEIIEKGKYATDKTIKEKVVYYVTDGERYHKKANCPSLHDSEIVYKAYISDIPEGRTSCGICY